MTTPETQADLFDWEDLNPLMSKDYRWHWDFVSIGLALNFDPRTLWSGAQLTGDKLRRAALKIRSLFVATKVVVEFALQFFEVLVEGLQARDPRLELNRRRIYETGFL